MGFLSGSKVLKAATAAGAGFATGGWAGAGIGAAGSLLGDADASSAYKYQKKLNETQMNWEERMSSTAHQREVEDLKAAGLNPVLSANAGASTPTGNAGSVNVTAAEKAMQALAIDNEKKRIKNETDTTKQNIKESIQRTKTNALQANLIRAQIDQLEAETPALRAESQNKKEYLESAIGGLLHKFGQGAQDLAVPITTLGGIAKGVLMAKGAKTISSAMKAGKDYRSKTQIQWKNKPDYNKYDWSLAKPIKVNFKGLR